MTPPPPPQPPLRTTNNKFTLHPFSQHTTRELQSEKICGPVWDERFRVMMYVNRDNANEIFETQTPSIFLEYVKTDNAEHWAECVRFEIHFVSRTTDEKVTFAANHRFMENDTDWGFSSTIPYKELQEKGMLDNDTLQLDVDISYYEDKTGVMWWRSEVPYDSKRITGHVGLNNQGATCYMNSILQSLFFTNALRRAIYVVPTDGDEPTKSVALAIQRVFWNLQVGDIGVAPLDTRELTRSFGWDNAESFMQHDVQEFTRVLLDNLETKMKGTISEKAIPELFYGKMKSYIKCINVEYESAREDDFSDIQLNVKGVTGLDEALKEYVIEELMDGDNQYRSDGHGLQDAKKGLIFTRLPAVLHMQLKRFEFDYEREQTIKINDRWEYPAQIDMSSYMETKPETPAIYNLHGVLVHSGDVGGGHYYAYIKPTADSMWYRFDDDRVIPVEENDVFELNYGSTVQPIPANRKLYKKMANAYMLIYVAQEASAKIFAPIAAEDVPAHLREKLEEERIANEKKEKEKQEDMITFKIQVSSNEIMRTHHGMELINYDHPHCPPTELPIVKARKDEKWAVAKGIISQQLGLDPSQVRFWYSTQRHNKTIRPDSALISTAQHNLDDKKLNEIHELGVAGLKYKQLYAELAKPGEVLDDSLIINDAHKYLFLKYFRPNETEESRILSFIDTVWLPSETKVGKLCEVMAQLSGDPPDTKYLIYEEVRPSMIEQYTNMETTLGETDLMHGDILVLMKASDMREPKLGETNEKMNPELYIKMLSNRVQVNFRPRVPPEGQEVSYINLNIDKDAGYDQICHALSTYVKHPPLQIRLHACKHGEPYANIARHSTRGLRDILGLWHQHGTPLFAYELMNRTIEELETHKTFQMFYIDGAGKEYGPYEQFVRKESSIDECVKQGLKEFGVSNDNVACYHVQDNKICRDLSNTQWVVDAIPDNDSFILVQEKYIPPDGYRPVHICHFHKTTSNAYGVPYIHNFPMQATIGEMKEEILRRLSQNMKELPKIRLAVVVGHKVEYPEDATVLAPDLQLLSPSLYIGIDHPGKGLRSTTTEKSIKIMG